MQKKLTEPFLACNEDWDYDNPPFKFPVYVTEKVDGIRVWDPEGDSFQTRRRKYIPNNFIQDTLNAKAPAYLDGEVVIPGASFHETQSLFSTMRGNPKFDYYVFDALKFPSADYPSRLRFEFDRHNSPLQLAEGCTLRWLLPVKISTIEDLHKWFTAATERGEEGLIVRDNGPYKFGRSTLTGTPMMLKMIPWKTAEATIVGFNEEMAQKDPTNPTVGGQIPQATLGSFRVMWKGAEFNLRGRLTHDELQTIWDNRVYYTGKRVTFKYKEVGMKNKPRNPTLIGVRHD